VCAASSNRSNLSEGASVGSLDSRAWDVALSGAAIPQLPVGIRALGACAGVRQCNQQFDIEEKAPGLKVETVHMNRWDWSLFSKRTPHPPTRPPGQPTAHPPTQATYPTDCCTKRKRGADVGFADCHTGHHLSCSSIDRQLLDRQYGVQAFASARPSCPQLSVSTEAPVDR